MPKKEIKQNIKENMTFSEAILLTLDGVKIRRASWVEGLYGFLFNDTLMFHSKLRDHDWIITKDDLMADDFLSI